MEAYLSALMTLLQPTNLIMMYLCAIVGCILGAIPGLSGGLGITLILPMTFALNTELSFAMLVGMYVGGVSGSFIAAVLVGIPGSAASIGTCYECGCLFGLVKSGGDVSFVLKNDAVSIFCVVLPSAILTALCGCAPWIVFFCLKSDQIFKCFTAFFKIRRYNWMKNLTREQAEEPA